MSESNVNVIITTKREGEAPQETLEDLKELKTGLTDLEKTVAGTRTTISGLDQDINLFGTSLGSTTDLLSGLGISIPISPMQLFGQAIQAAGQYAKEAIGEYTGYVEEISKMAAFTSTTTEEMSRMYQVADDLRIPVSALQMALKTMADHGTAPSIAGLMQLSDEYLAIRDPLQQAQFLTDNFGRSGQEMARLMGLGSEAIEDQAGAIADWMVVTKKAEEEVEQFEKTSDAWNETWMEIRYTFVQDIVPVVTALGDAIIETHEQIKDSDVAIFRHIGTLGAWGDVIAIVIRLFENLSEKSKEVSDSVAEDASQAKAEMNDLNAAIDETAYSYSTNPWFHPQRGEEEPVRGSYYGVEGRAGGGEMFPGSIYRVGEREIEYISSPLGGMVTPGSQAAQQPIIFNYSPMISTADRAEAENTLLPVIRAALRRA